MVDGELLGPSYCCQPGTCIRYLEGDLTNHAGPFLALAEWALRYTVNLPSREVGPPPVVVELPVWEVDPLVPAELATNKEGLPHWARRVVS